MINTKLKISHRLNFSDLWKYLIVYYKFFIQLKPISNKVNFTEFEFFNFFLAAFIQKLFSSGNFQFVTL